MSSYSSENISNSGITVIAHRVQLYRQRPEAGSSKGHPDRSPTRQVCDTGSQSHSTRRYFCLSRQKNRVSSSMESFGMNEPYRIPLDSSP